MKDSFFYNNRDKSIKINYSNYYKNDERTYSDLFDFLSQFNVITASELGNDEIIYEGSIYFFSELDELILMNSGQIKLRYFAELNNYCNKTINAHKDFLTWYFNNDN